MIPSEFVSNSASASKPDDDTVPSDRITWLPNNSSPLSIIPLPFRSSAKKPSSFPIHAVFSAKPLQSRSKYTPSFIVHNSIPFFPKSIISGSLGGCAPNALS